VVIEMLVQLGAGHRQLRAALDAVHIAVERLHPEDELGHGRAPGCVGPAASVKRSPFPRRVAAFRQETPFSEKSMRMRNSACAISEH
jgi:hypothetical protein